MLKLSVDDIHIEVLRVLKFLSIKPDVSLMPLAKQVQCVTLLSNMQIILYYSERIDLNSVNQQLTLKFDVFHPVVPIIT
jgi:hypothetical protein